MDKKRGQTVVLSQAERVFFRFGGVLGLVRALKEAGFKKNESTVRRWAYPESRNGTGGVIPAHDWPAIAAAAKLYGLILTDVEMSIHPKKIAVTATSAYAEGKAGPVVTAARKALLVRLKKLK